MAKWFCFHLLEAWHPGNLAGRFVGAHVYPITWQLLREGASESSEGQEELPSHSSPYTQRKEGGDPFHAPLSLAWGVRLPQGQRWRAGRNIQ